MEKCKEKSVAFHITLPKISRVWIPDYIDFRASREHYSSNFLFVCMILRLHPRQYLVLSSAWQFYLMFI